MASLAENPKIFHDYEILETLEAGMVLLGFEAKAIQNNMASLKGSYVKILGGEPYLINAHIGPYQVANTPKDYDPTRARKLLLTQKEILHLFMETREKGLTLVPIRIYTKGRRIKVAIGLAKGKKDYDKREKLKEKATRRELRMHRF